jgi:ubiquitin C-terminal hydrolase
MASSSLRRKWLELRHALRLKWEIFVRLKISFFNAHFQAPVCSVRNCLARGLHRSLAIAEGFSFVCLLRFLIE